LGANASAYNADNLQKAMLSKRYDLQSALYLLALHRLLKARLGESYHYQQHIGGSLYLFLRGVHGPAGGRVFYKPAQTFIETLDALFTNSPAAGANP